MYKTRFQRNGKTLALTTELRTLRLTVVTNPNLAEVFHIMHIQPHHMPQSMRIEQGMCAFAYSIFGIAFHQTEFFHALYHYAGGKVVNIHIRNTRTKRFDSLQMHCILNFINSPLTRGKRFIGRNGRGHIARITRLHFRTGINQE